MEWPRWTLREMLVAVGWISVGLAMARVAFDVRALPSLLQFPILMGAGWAIGAGIGTIVGGKSLGGRIGLWLVGLAPWVLLLLDVC